MNRSLPVGSEESIVAIRRKTTGTGRMRYLLNVPRRFKSGFREEEAKEEGSESDHPVAVGEESGNKGKKSGEGGRNMGLKKLGGGRNLGGGKKLGGRVNNRKRANLGKGT
ncbi:hypothetical protein GBA52_014531 [Prunus armeniaca]|nr:hypothetical protein GBA52_014531 [Prunus armeniaca]